jgi:hypothetical protein
MMVDDDPGDPGDLRSFGWLRCSSIIMMVLHYCTPRASKLLLLCPDIEVDKLPPKSYYGPIEKDEVLL